MEQLEVVFGLFVVLAAIATLARRIEVPYPILLVMGGLVIGLVPGLPRVEVDPNLILRVFLPPLLYAAALAMPPRELRDSLRPISLLAFGLVLFTMTAVAVVAHATIDGLLWAAGFTLERIRVEQGLSQQVYRRLNTTSTSRSCAWTGRRSRTGPPTRPIESGPFGGLSH
jgi:monovalent cation/hydrogen antiporter